MYKIFIFLNLDLNGNLEHNSIFLKKYLEDSFYIQLFRIDNEGFV
jgi:hypothetical protein